VELLTVEVELDVVAPPQAESRNKKDKAMQLALSWFLLDDLFIMVSFFLQTHLCR
jgi:hypothetical protein